MTDEDVLARTQALLAKVEREVERRKAEELVAPPAEEEPPAPVEAEAEGAVAVAVAPPAAADPAPAAEPAAAPVIAPARLTPGPLAASTDPVTAPPRPISVPAAGAPPAKVPATPEELASGVAAARRRLAIISVQLDELANTVEQLAAYVPGGPDALPGAPLAPRRAGPPPPAMAPLPPAPPPAPEIAQEEAHAEAEAEAAVADELPAAALPGPTPPPAIPVGGMRVRPRPPGQHHHELSPMERARKTAVEMAVQGRTRGEAEQVLREQVGLAETDAVLNPIYGLGTGPDALMPRS